MANVTDWGSGGCEDIDIKPSVAKNDVSDSFSNEVIPPGKLHHYFSTVVGVEFLNFSLPRLNKMFWTFLMTCSATTISTMNSISVRCHRTVSTQTLHSIIRTPLNGVKTSKTTCCCRLHPMSSSPVNHQQFYTNQRIRQQKPIQCSVQPKAP